MSIDRILWLVSDTVRADYLGYGGGHVHTPNLDALAARSTVFDRHYAVSFPTVPARYDFLVGRAAYCGVGWNGLPPDQQTVPGLLDEAGFTTAGIVDTPFFTTRGFNYERGFKYFYDMKTQPVGTPDYYVGAPSDWYDQWWDRPIHGKLLPEPRISESDHAAP